MLQVFLVCTPCVFSLHFTKSNRTCKIDFFSFHAHPYDIIVTGLWTWREQLLKKIATKVRNINKNNNSNKTTFRSWTLDKNEMCMTCLQSSWYHGLHDGLSLTTPDSDPLHLSSTDTHTHTLVPHTLISGYCTYTSFHLSISNNYSRIITLVCKQHLKTSMDIC